jgi:hypothetical protein
MKLYYNSFDISALGEISIKQSRELLAEGQSFPDQPQRAKVRLEVTLDLFLPTYDQNRAQIDSLRTALLLPNAVLQWTNDAVGVDYVNQTAVLVSEDLPEEWGQYHQTLHLVFAYYEQTPGGATNNLPLTFCKEGSGTAYQFDVVNRWQHSAGTERFSTLRKQRRETRGKIHVEGQVLADGQLPLAQRRTNLAAAAAAMTEQMNSAEGLLQFGAQPGLGTGGSVFNGMVRIEEFACDLDQLVNAINFSFTCSYTLFPDETAYATAEFTVEERDNFTGELTLTVAGKIQAQDEAGARVKLAAVFGQVLTDREYLAGQQLSLMTTPNAISANEDGDTFTELAFAGTWRKWRATNQIATVLADGHQDGHQDPVPLGNVTKWVDRVDTSRFTPLRAQRERTTGVIEAGGTWTVGQNANTSSTSSTNSQAVNCNTNIVANRAALLAMQRAMKAEVATPEITLSYGDWTQVVRVNSFTAEINQAETGIDWSLTADYILFPNLASYATATYTMTERDNFTGELHLAIGGRIQAQDEPAARVKLAAILQQALTDRSFNKGVQILSMETAPNIIDDDADGATFTELTFAVEYRKWKKSNLMASFGTPAVGLGNVSKWQDRVSISRFNPLRSLRERASDTIDAAGTLAGDANLGLASRRAALLALQRKLKAAVNVPDGLLVYGDFKQVVRVTEFNAEINQAETGIDWSLSATYTLFPDESNYTTTEWTADQKDNFTGETTLVLAGRIQAATLALAQTKLAALTAAVAQPGPGTQPGLGITGTKLQQLTNDQTSNNLSTLDGDTFIELSFSVSWRQWKSTNQMATFKASNGGTLRGLGNVNRWRDHYAAARFNEMRSQRRHATGSVEASGTLAGQANLSLTARRAALLALQRQLKAQVNCADGTLTYGDWNQCVRVDDFQAEINQAETGIDWSLSASYSLFPNEGGYATAEYTVNDREDVESGDEFFTFNGKISAPTQALAMAKLNSLRTAILSMYGWTLAQRLRDETTSQSIYANGDTTTYPTGSVPDGASSMMDAADGTTFIELSFSEEYRRRIQGLLVGSTLQVSNREDIPAQTLVTTFAGTVTATGPTPDAAYATALARAQALGANREAAIDSTAFLRGSMISFEQRQLTQGSATEFLRLTFSYEYQSKVLAGRAYIEMTSTVNREAFGVDVESCSGFVARDAATAQSIFADCVRATYDGRLIHSEQTGFSQLLAQRDQPDAGPDCFNQQFLRMEFSLQVYSPKLEGELGMKYSVEVTRDFLTLEMRTALEGSCFALDRPTADAAVSVLMLALNFGSPNGGLVNVRSRRHEDRETNGTTDVMLKLDFQEDFVGRVTGQAGVIEMKLTEKVVYSETRWSVQNLPFESDGSGGVSIPQPSGVDPGSRVVSGSVTAATLATAQAWAIKQRALLTGDELGGSYPRQEEWETDYEFVPRIDGIPTGNTANVRLYRVNFTFGEILPLYPKQA